MSEEKPSIRVVLDGVFFQLANTGIARYWRSVLAHWDPKEAGCEIFFLNRGGQIPQNCQIKLIDFEPFRYESSGEDALKCEVLCKELKADLFLSTYYTTPTETPSITIFYDMIPERMGLNLKQRPWREKRLSILHADNVLTISKSSQEDLKYYYPDHATHSTYIAYSGVEENFYPVEKEKILSFRQKYKLEKLYLLVVGTRMTGKGYKNTELIFKAMHQWKDANRYQIVCAGGLPQLETRLKRYLPDKNVLVKSFSDEELTAAYAGAHCCVYPSRYEGFGQPIVEAMKCGCPVITCFNSSLKEIGKDAVLYINPDSIIDLREKILELEEPVTRSRCIQRGFKEATSFTWENTAIQVKKAILSAVRNQTKNNPVQWHRFRTLQAELQRQSIDDESLSAFEETWLAEQKSNRNFTETEEAQLLQRFKPSLWGQAKTKSVRYLKKRAKAILRKSA
ncbi:Glycosyltransferase involved in cell wall biosynthesis [Planctomycetales bacterium 10988]|nr:Glycosyltransferase involved in cell wall biosynthesis [Planctomycetales bacterium 10988]